MTYVNAKATERQVRAVELARKYIAEDGDRAARPVMGTDFNVRVRQTADSEVVRTWVAMPDGRLTWTS